MLYFGAATGLIFLGGFLTFLPAWFISPIAKIQNGRELMSNYHWRACGIICLAVGLIGAVMWVAVTLPT
jgi:hypothetical protein